MPTKNPDLIRAKQARWMAKTRDAMLNDLNDPRHGKLTGYSVGCRCVRCAATNSDWRRNRRQRNA